MMIPRLTEWLPSGPISLTSQQRRVLEEHFDATIRSAASDDTFVVTPGSVVGSISIDGIEVVVQPKFEIDRVLFMLAYANDPLNWEDEWAQMVGTEDLVDGVAGLFVRACDRTLSRGLYRSYRPEESDQLAIRGRVRWERQARRAAPLPIALRFAVHDDNVIENQLVRAALDILRTERLSDREVAAGVARLWRQFREFDRVNTPLAHLERLTWTRQNEHYRPLLNLTALILQSTMADIGRGTTATVGFTLTLPKVFEQFVRTALRESWELSITELPDTTGAFGLRLDRANKVGLHPDLNVRVDHRWVFVGDVKYKRDHGKGRDADLYQLLAYATATGLRQATLIYADGPAPATCHAVRNADVELRLVRLDLSRSPWEVLEQLGSVPLRA